MRQKRMNVSRYLPGIILIGLGLVIVAFPMLLVAFVSALLILAGMLAIGFARKIVDTENEIHFLFDSRPFERSFWNQAEKIFYRGRWH